MGTIRGLIGRTSVKMGFALGYEMEAVWHRYESQASTLMQGGGDSSACSQHSLAAVHRMSTGHPFYNPAGERNFNLVS